MSSTTFPAAYAEARAAFCEEATAAGAMLEAHPHPDVGPTGEALATDVARFGDPGARRVLVVGSGTHGVEGRAGAGIQRRLIADGRVTRPPAGTAVLLVHAINPFGFAHTRRVDHTNVDVNRNFVDHDSPHPENPAYEGLRPVLNPAEPDLDPDDESWMPALEAYGREHGPLAAYQAVMGGQYEHPDGLQFGGERPSWSNATLHGIWARHLEGAELAVNIDLHTGLGARGEGTLMQTADRGEAAAVLAHEWWGPVLRADRPVAGDVLTSGVLGPGFDHALDARRGASASGAGAASATPRTVSVVLEFGTIAPMTVLSAMRADNWLWNHGRRDTPRAHDIAARMRSAFFVDDPAWETSVLDRAHDVVARALDGLTAT